MVLVLVSPIINNNKEQKPTAIISLATASENRLISASAQVGIGSFDIELSIPQRAYRLRFENALCHYSPKMLKNYL
jgi:hypothetical protein